MSITKSKWSRHPLSDAQIRCAAGASSIMVGVLPRQHRPSSTEERDAALMGCTRHHHTAPLWACTHQPAVTCAPPLCAQLRGSGRVFRCRGLCRAAATVERRAGRAVHRLRRAAGRPRNARHDHVHGGGLQVGGEPCRLFVCACAGMLPQCSRVGVYAWLHRCPPGCPWPPGPAEACLHRTLGPARSACTRGTWRPSTQVWLQMPTR